MRRRALAAAAALATLAIAPAAADSRGDRAPVTPSGWRVTPAGTELGVSRLATGFQGPLGSDLAPDGRHVLSASSGAARFQSADLFDIAKAGRVDYAGYDADRGESVFYGVAFSPDGGRAWVAGGGQNVVHEYRVAGDDLSETRAIPVPGFPAGIAYGHTPKGDRIYVVNNLAANAAGGANPPGHTVTVIDPASGTVTGTIELGTPLQPIGVAFDRGGRKAYVTNWMGRSVSVIDTRTEAKTTDVELSPQSNPLQADHPGAVAANPKRDELYVANSSSDTVSVIDTRTDRLAATIDVALVRGGPKGANPDGVDVSPDGRTLYVAEAGEDAVAVVDLDRRGTAGFVPTSWYPADVDVTPDGRRLVVTNANDSGAGPNPCGPTAATHPGCPAKDPNRDEAGRDSIDPQYSGSMIKGSLTVVDVPRSREALARATAQVRDDNQAPERAARAPRRVRDHDAIKHVIYVIKENRTYDQVFGDLPRGDGDPSLQLFGDESAPNHRELARRFTLLDNFYADAEVSADGHNWATQANATDYVDRTWPVNYSPFPRSRQRAYDFENVPLAQQFASEPLASDPTVPRSAAAQTAGYLWDNAYDHGVSYRDYGEYTRSPGDCNPNVALRDNESDTTRLNDARFGEHVDGHFPGYNTACSDHRDREPEWEREFRQYAHNGDLPQLSIVRFPNDHTNGTRAGSATPRAYVADNDLALGRLVDVVSHSVFWKDTLILVTEDDAQNGPDHVDAHRTVALAISPYTQVARTDSTHYDTASMIATAEDLLGLPPMSIFDARVNRMWGSFTSRPDFRPYDARTPSVTPFGASGAPVNARNAPMARQAASWDLAREDAAPEIALNESIWKSVRGRHARMPRPRHEYIIGSQPNDEGD
jgi:YVTN family beta-propeller protein